MSASIEENSPNRTTTPRTKRNLFEFLFNKVNSFYERIFSAIGESIGQRPIIFLLFSLLLTGICSLGFLRLKIINDVDQLFIPTDSQSIQDREKVAELLPLDFDDYYLHQDFDLGRYGEVIFIPDDSGNIDRPKVREEIERIYNLIEKINITYQNRTYFYGDLCAKRSGKCVVEGDIFFLDSFWQVLREKTLDKFMIGQVYNDAESGPNFLPFIFGSEMKLDFKAGTLDSRVIKFRFNLRRDQSLEKLSQLWEAAFLEFFDHFRSVIVKHFYSISTSIDKELENNINLDINLVGGTFVLMILVATICLSLRVPFSQSPIHLSGIGVSATMLGLVSGFGFCLLMGVPICSLVFVTPFLVIGVGTDDMFLIFSAYLRTKSNESTSRRLSETFRLCGSGITVTSLTNVIAFLAGATTNFYGIRLFCFYTSASMAFCYIYQITLFGSSVALYNNCINENRHTLCLCRIDRSSSKSERRRRHNRRRQCLPWKDMFIHIIDPLFTKTGQIIVCLTFVIFVILSVYNASQMRDGMKFGQLLSDKSYATSFFDTLDTEFDLYPLVQFIVTKPISYWRLDQLRRLEDLIKAAKQIDGMDPDLEMSWLKILGYNSFDYPFDNGTKFIEMSQGLGTIYPAFRHDLVMNSTHILVGRVFLKMARVCYNSTDGYLIQQLRSLVEQSELPIIVYSNLFKYYEQMYEVIPNIIQTFAIAIEAMYFVTLLIIPDLKSVLMIISTMLMILVSLIGTLHIWGVQASSVMMVELVMSIGFCSDFCVHIVHAFLTANGNRKERARQALINMGIPILCASLSSVIGIFLLAFAHSYLFRTFFKTIIALMALGTVHALCFLPVMLSLIGSDWDSHRFNLVPTTNNHVPMPLNKTKRSNEQKTISNIDLKARPNIIEEEDDDAFLSNSTKNESL